MDLFALGNSYQDIITQLAEIALDELDAKWDDEYPMVIKLPNRFSDNVVNY